MQGLSVGLALFVELLSCVGIQRCKGWSVWDAEQQGSDSLFIDQPSKTQKSPFLCWHEKLEDEINPRNDDEDIAINLMKEKCAH